QFHLSEEAEKRVRKKFRDPNALPKILIVTEKLLTGFDAPVLYCMYLDKPMRDHVLLQAIARVNRPYEAEGKGKPCGLVLDFVGIFANLEKALAFDSQDIEGVVRDIELLKVDFGQKIEFAREHYLSVIRGHYGDKAVEAVLVHFQDETIRQEFYQFFKGLSESYDIISPDAFLRPYINDMETLARMYRMLREAYEPGIDVDRDFSKKVAQLVQEHTSGGRIRDTIEVYQINDRTLELIEQSQVSDTERVFNLLKSIEKEVREHVGAQPYLKSIGEKAALIIELFKSGQKQTLEALEELKKLIVEINEARAEQQAKNLPKEIFSIYWVLKNEGIGSPEACANQMIETFQRYPHFRTSSAQEREVRSKLFSVLVKSGLKDMERVKAISETIMRVLKGDSV
ncbi:MAG: type I restriction endonuclease subunit R, partial [candidate division KSB1 bacterium]|nr:type I restriction endonuclease subunit R [candidate division KSB1 bacterium]